MLVAVDQVSDKVILYQTLIRVGPQCIIVCSIEEIAVELRASLTMLEELYQFHLHACHTLGVLEAAAQVLPIAVVRNNLVQGHRVAETALEIVMVAQRNNRTTGRRYLPGMANMLNTTGERRVHDNHLDVTDFFGRKFQKVISDHPTLVGQ